MTNDAFLLVGSDSLGTFKFRLDISVFSSIQLTLTLPAASGSEVTT